jgi:cell division septation protein DedD
MNRKPNEKWTLRLGLSQVVILLGVTTGCLALSFYLGFFSGKRVGFSEAMDTNIALVPKIPIESNVAVDPGQVDSAEKAVADVYADLKNTNTKSAESTSSQGSDMPEIGVIEKVEQKNQKDLANVFADDLPAASVTNTANGTTNKDPWAVSKANNQAEPMVIGDDIDEATGANDAIDKALNDIATPLPKSKTTVAATSTIPAVTIAPIATTTIATVVTIAPTAIPTVVPTKAPTKTPTATPTKVKVDPKASTSESSDVGATISKAAKSGWYAQVAAPTSKAEADSLASQLRNNGFRVVIESAQVRGDSYFRILVGPEENRAQADALVKQLTRESYLKGAPFIRMIK